jgi:hypothetical protein
LAAPEASRVLDLLAALSRTTDLAGEILRAVYELQLDGVVTTLEEAQARARTLTI